MSIPKATHTKEPWHLFDGAKLVIVTKDGPCSDAEAIENAARAISCVNACAGISTELLEAAPIVAVVGQMAQSVSDSEKDALRQRVQELEAKANMDYAIIAGDNAMIAGLKDELAELRKAQGEPVTQFRKAGCADWYDGRPDVDDGNGPYEVRTLYAGPEPTFREPDLHTPGIYVVIDADGAPVPDTLATTGYSARSEFVREKNLLWSKAQEQGYHVVELRPV